MDWEFIKTYLESAWLDTPLSLLKHLKTPVLFRFDALYGVFLKLEAIFTGCVIYLILSRLSLA